MKAKLLFILMSFSLLSFGQSTTMLVDTNKLWSNLFSRPTGGPPPLKMTTSFVKFSGDTLIDSKHFKKVFINSDSLQSNYVLSGYIHEDSTNKVFYRTKNDTSNKLLYDFNVEVGDTINIEWWIQSKLVVGVVDSIFIYNKFLKRIVLSPHGGSFG